jgi:glycosyltransferase involved in cell wall biosynthesis
MSRIAVLIPCYNESLTIAKVVNDYRAVLPDADIYVYDNNSVDHTDEIARDVGAIVKYERRQGKGNVIRSMFRDIEADCYLMIDGDDTYPAENAVELCKYVLEYGADMVIGDRLSSTYFAENHYLKASECKVEHVSRVCVAIFALCLTLGDPGLLLAVKRNAVKLALIFYAAYQLAVPCLQYIYNKYERINRNDAKLVDRRFANKVGVYAFLFLICCWIPCWLAYYPAVLTPDSIGQIKQILGLASLVNHHSIAHTMSIKMLYTLA